MEIRPSPWGVRGGWQHGLSSSALRKLGDNVQDKVLINFDKRSRLATPTDMIIAEEYRRFCDGQNEFVPLYRYIYPDGTEYQEEVQVEFEGNGHWRCFALKDQWGHWVADTLWSNEEIESAKQALEAVDWVKIERVIKH